MHFHFIFSEKINAWRWKKNLFNKRSNLQRALSVHLICYVPQRPVVWKLVPSEWELYVFWKDKNKFSVRLTVNLCLCKDVLEQSAKRLIWQMRSLNYTLESFWSSKTFYMLVQRLQWSVLVKRAERGSDASSYQSISFPTIYGLELGVEGKIADKWWKWSFLEGRLGSVLEIRWRAQSFRKA